MSEDKAPEGFEWTFVQDGAHHFARALKCSNCPAVLEAEGNTPESAVQNAIALATEHACNK